MKFIESSLAPVQSSGKKDRKIKESSGGIIGRQIIQYGSLLAIRQLELGHIPDNILPVKKIFFFFSTTQVIYILLSLYKNSILCQLLNHVNFLLQFVMLLLFYKHFHPKYDFSLYH